MPYGTPCDPGTSTATVSTRTTGTVTAEEAGLATHPARAPSPAVKAVAPAPPPAGESPAFGPLFLAHQALML